MTEEEQAAQVAQEQADAAQAAAKVEKEATTAKDAQTATDGLTAEELRAKLTKANAEAAGRRVANKQLEEAQAASAKKIAAFEAAEEKRRVETLSEIEKEKDRADKAEVALLAKEAELSLEQRRRIVTGAGVDEEYSGIVADQLEAAQKATEGLDAKAWLEDMKARKPALFTGASASTKTAGGPAGTGNASKVELLETQMKKERDPMIRTAMFRELQTLRKEA